MRSFRTIYMIEEISEDRCEIISRYFAANKALAEKIARRVNNGCEVIITKLAKRDWQYVNMQEVKR